MNTEQIKLYDREDQLIDLVTVPKRQDDQPPRRLIYKGRVFVEGGGEDSFYGLGEFAEVVKGE